MPKNNLLFYNQYRRIRKVQRKYESQDTNDFIIRKQIENLMLSYEKGNRSEELFKKMLEVK